MSQGNRCSPLLPLALACALAAVDATAGAIQGATATATVLQAPQTSCRWQALPLQLPARYQAAGVYEAEARCLYYYGGLDAGGTASADVHVIDLSDPDIDNATIARSQIDGQQPEPRWGHAGVVRAPSTGEPEILWIGGQRGEPFEPTATPIPPRTPRPTRTPTPCPT